MELSVLPGVDASHVYVRALALGCFYSHISARTFRRALTASVDSCAEIQWRNQIWQSLEEGAGKRCSECVAVRASVKPIMQNSSKQLERLGAARKAVPH